MKKLFYTLLLFCLPGFLMAQAEEANLLYNWQDSTLVINNWPGGRYNEVWGTYINGREIGIIGSTAGVHFIDVTDPAAGHEIESAFIPGAAQGAIMIHRDYHDYDGYLYTVADEGASTLQVIDMHQLPDTAFVVYDSNEFIVKSHNIFIDADAARLYSTGGEGVTVLSLENPEVPVLIGQFPNAGLALPYAHDLYVRNDTAYLNCGNDGLWAVDFTDIESPQILGNMTIYEQQGYNHAGWMHETEPYYYLADETHGMDVKVVTVSDHNDMNVINTFDAESPAQTSIPHNLIVRGDYLYVSYYYDGVQVYDISDPENPVRAFYYDTYAGADMAGFHGAWGVYPYFPSGNILVSDMQTGLYLFEAVDATITSTELPEILTGNVSVWPQPANQELNVAIEFKEAVRSMELELIDMNGKQLSSWARQHLEAGKNNIKLELPAGLAEGIYFLNMKNESFSVTGKILIQK